MTKPSVQRLTGIAVAVCLNAFAADLILSKTAAAPTTARLEADTAPRPRELGRIDTVKLFDPARKKELLCRVTYPAQATSPCPVLIFSHGAMGSKDSYDYLIDYLCSCGYVCIQPSHADSLMLVSKAQRLLAARQTVKELPQDAAAWDNRAKDISFIIDSLPVIQNQLPVHLDADKIACGGHSLGAFTSALVGGAEPPPPATRKNYLDNRVRAIIMMSPQGVRHSDQDFGFADKQAWQHLNLPCLFLTGTLDNTTWSSYEDRKVPFLSSPAQDKYMAVVTGASHMTFSGQGNGLLLGDNSAEGGKANPFRQYLTRQLSESMTPDQGDRTVMLKDICSITETFLDAYLKHNALAKQNLAKSHAFGDLVDITSR